MPGASAPAPRRDEPAAPCPVAAPAEVPRDWIELSGGRFRMGCDRGEGFAEDGEGPSREVELSPFAIAATTVTNAEFRDFDQAELALIEPLRVLRQVHWAGWIAQRWHDPAFPQGFPFVGEARWWEQHIGDLNEAALRLEQ